MSRSRAHDTTTFLHIISISFAYYSADRLSKKTRILPFKRRNIYLKHRTFKVGYNRRIEIYGTPHNYVLMDLEVPGKIMKFFLSLMSRSRVMTLLYSCISLAYYLHIIVRTDLIKIREFYHLRGEIYI